MRQLVLWDIHANKYGSFQFGGHCILYLVRTNSSQVEFAICLILIWVSAFIVYKCCETTIFIFMCINSANSLIWHIKLLLF